MNAPDSDRIVAIVGVLMALALILGAGGWRVLKGRRGLTTAFVWLVIIVAAALVFRGFHR